MSPSEPGTERLVVRSTPLDSTEPLVSLVPKGVAARDVVTWLRSGEGMVGWGRVAALDLPTAHVSAPSDTRRFEVADAWWRAMVAVARIEDEVGTPGSGLLAFGSFAFAPDSPAGSALVVPSTIVGRRGGTTWITHITRESAAPPAPVRTASPPCGPGQVRYADGQVSAPAYETAVARAVDRIAGGALDKVVLARDLAVDAEEDIDPRWLTARLAEHYAKTWVFCVDGLVGATPEMLVRLDRGLVTSRVLAGTIRRTGDDEHDLALAGSLARSSKDLEEHEYAVRSVADALAPHCTSMNVPDSPTVLHLPNVMHLATDVTGRLRNGASSVLLAGALHPSAAVCGTPTGTAGELIAELEGMDRGRYAGPVGWVDASGDGEWGIGLRSGALDPGCPRRMRLFAGCGIVAGSDPQAELAESDAKLIPMRTALEAAALR